SVAGIDVEICGALSRHYLACFRGGALKSPGCGCPDCNDAPAARSRSVHYSGTIFRNNEALRLYPVFFYLLYSNWLKSTIADVVSDCDSFDTASLYLFQNAGCEV